MSKNLIPEIAKMLGVEINKSFKLAGYDNATFRFTENRFWQENGNSCEERSDILAMLLAGNEIIIKLPWKPKKGDDYFTFMLLSDKWVVRSLWWSGFPNEYALLDKGWVFRTRKEAKAALPKVAAEMGVEYEL